MNEEILKKMMRAEEMIDKILKNIDDLIYEHKKHQYLIDIYGKLPELNYLEIIRISVCALKDFRNDALSAPQTREYVDEKINEIATLLGVKEGEK